MTIAKAGAGSKFFMSSSNANGSFVPVAQLKTFAHQGSKQTIVDQTNISTPDNFSRPLAVRIDSGEINLDGVLDPANTSILQLGTAHASMALYYFLAVLSDGTQYTFQGLVSEYAAFSVSYSKAMLFSAKIRISGALTGPAGAA